MTAVTRIPGNRNLTMAESITGCLGVGSGREGVPTEKEEVAGIMNRFLSLW